MWETWTKVVTAIGCSVVAIVAIAVYVVGFHGKIPCDQGSWPEKPFDKVAWQQTESSKRYVYAKSLIAFFSQSRLKRGEIIEMLGMPENEDHNTHDLEYLIGETRFCPFPYVTTLDVGFASFGQNKAVVRFDW